MSRIGNTSKGIFLGLLLLAVALGTAHSMKAQGQAAAPAYTREEYDAYIACNNEKVPEQKIKCLDDFSAKYPKSALMIYIDNAYLLTYSQLKDYPKVIDAVDKLLSLPNLDPLSQFQARVGRAQAFLAGASTKELATPQQMNAARDSAKQALASADSLPKPEKVSAEDWEKFKNTDLKNDRGMLTQVLATASMGLKDGPGTISAYKSLLALDPTDSMNYYRLGVAYLTMVNPPQFMDGIWALARSVALKGSSEAQVRAYLTKLVLNYQGGAVCPTLLDGEVNELVTLAAGSPDRPTSYNLPSSDDLSKMQNDTANFIPYLREGGDHGKLMWLATCGLDYPEIVAKLISIDAPADGPIVLHVFTGTTPEETQNGTVADMDVKLDGSQPDAKKIAVNDELRFGATLVGYDQNPFLLHWEKGKVNPDDIPSESGKKPPAKKKPGGR